MTQWFSWLHFFGGRDLPVETPWPPPQAEEDAAEETHALSPVAAPIHIAAGSSVARVDNGVLIVERQGEPPYERPLELVSALHVHGWATVTSPCVAQLIAQGSPVIWRGPTGYPIGFAGPLHRAGLDVRRAQYASAGRPAGFAIAQALVAAKIVNMRGLVRRRAALGGRECLVVLQQYARETRQAASMQGLLGLEGAATARYFAAWPNMLAARAGDLTFEGRSRRPPQDEVNALLSYAYAVLCGECLTACTAAGLDLRQGFLHQPRAGRPALALDVMEPFRPLIADQAMLSGLNNGQFKSEHFRREGHAILLTEEGRRLAIGILERRLLGAVTLDGRAEPMTWRDTIGLCARMLADSLRTGQPFRAVERA
jgi:CRISPR-associated endonuclease Cas1